MQTNEKIYTPEVISDTPFPDQDQESLDSSSTGASTGVYSPSTIKDNPLPRRMIAHELLNERLNTKTGNILGQFNFQPSGALQIGLYKDGESGDIRISPNGIVARDKYGINTIAIDGETGDVVIRGSLQSGSVITGDIAIEEGGSISIGGDPILDEQGIVSSSIANFTETSTSSLNQNITSTSDTQLTGSSLEITVTRPVKLLLMATIQYYLSRNSGSGDFGAYIWIDIFKNGSQIGSNADIAQVPAYYNDTTKNTDGPLDAMTHSNIFEIITLPVGTHTLDLKGRLSNKTGDPKLVIYSYNFTYIKLGT